MLRNIFKLYEYEEVFLIFPWNIPGSIFTVMWDFMYWQADMRGA